MDSNVPDTKGKAPFFEPVKLNRRKVFTGLGKLAVQNIAIVLAIKGICQFMGVPSDNVWTSVALALTGSVMMVKFMMLILLSAEVPDHADGAGNVPT